ncbi:uncharacterized protein L201_003965 [Kwoniella dendrophila CBS 6074]|uniref:Uncharacterized protein n=1 Tax=Kwoniella dendrophila CBS 6074 TaxID=1295534 RepID=A0AAX4JUL2_9TREE
MAESHITFQQFCRNSNCTSSGGGDTTEINLTFPTSTLITHSNESSNSASEKGRIYSTFQYYPESQRLIRMSITTLPKSFTAQPVPAKQNESNLDEDPLGEIALKKRKANCLNMK